MSLSNPNKPVTEERLQEFYHKLVPYMGGGSGGGGGHTIEDSEGTDLTQRDILQFGEGFLAEDDDTNEKTVISPDVMQSGDMDDVITPLPSVAPKKEGIKYSTTEQVVGEWIDGKPIYQKTFTGTWGTITDKTSFTQTITIGTNAVDVIETKGYSIINSSNRIEFNQAWDNNFCYYTRAFQTSSTQITIGTNRDIFSNKSFVITIQYTKTTDTPNT